MHRLYFISSFNCQGNYLKNWTELHTLKSLHLKVYCFIWWNDLQMNCNHFWKHGATKRKQLKTFWNPFLEELCYRLQQYHTWRLWIQSQGWSTKLAMSKTDYYSSSECNYQFRIVWRLWIDNILQYRVKRGIAPHFRFAGITSPPP